ncbi:MAG: hypothetical protein HYR85_02465 [Planctomycetes bacterium]|nr:hypothetical protein [Planctomycetota bacterium]MBI3846885.1 hypothetical protein [Planctomycetota bacterium]
MTTCVGVAVAVLISGSALGQVRSNPASHGAGSATDGSSGGPSFSVTDGDGWLSGTIVIDGRNHDECRVVVLTIREIPDGSRFGLSESAASSCAAPATLEDAWTSSLDCSRQCEGEAEAYTFPIDSDPTAFDQHDICFVNRIKVSAQGLPNGFLADIVVVRADPRTVEAPDGEDICFPHPNPSSRPVLMIDDAEFPPMPPDAQGCPYEAVVAVCLPGLNSRLAATCTGPSSCAFDWFEIAEFEPLACPDVDGDGKPDAGIVLGVGNRFGSFCVTSATDNIGAEVLDFFVNGSHSETRCLNVLEAHPPLPSRGFPGVGPGEDGLTRPWSFSVEIPSGFGPGGTGPGPKEDGAIQSGKGPGSGG